MDVSASRKSISINKKLAERVGFSNALYYRPCPFNEMPKTEVLTSIYVLSHLQHESQKEH